jgi:hypothetical protein
MNLRTLLGIGSLLLIGTGCPHDWMKEGTNDRAMAKDTREMLDDDDEEACPDGMTLQEDCEHRRPGEPCPLRCQ